MSYCCEISFKSLIVNSFNLVGVTIILCNVTAKSKIRYCFALLVDSMKFWYAVSTASYNFDLFVFLFLLSAVNGCDTAPRRKEAATKVPNTYLATIILWIFLLSVIVNFIALFESPSHFHLVIGSKKFCRPYVLY